MSRTDKDVSYKYFVAEAARKGYYVHDHAGVNNGKTINTFKGVVTYTTYECTPGEFYDPETDTDIRDGGKALCYPDLWEARRAERKSYSMPCECCGLTVCGPSKNAVRSVIVNLINAFNSGEDIDDWDDLSISRGRSFRPRRRS